MASSEAPPPRLKKPLRVLLDSNVLIADFHLARNMFTQILGVLDQVDATLVVPQIVIDEVVNKFREQLTERKSKLEKASEELSRTLARTIAPVAIDLDGEVNSYRAELLAKLRRANASVVAYPVIPHDQVVARALTRRRPFDLEGHKGYRDALIWENVLTTAASDGPDVVLVSINANDFADKDKTALHPHLIEDLKERGLAVDRVVYCENLETLSKVHFTPRLPSADELGKLLENGVLAKLDLGNWIAENLPSLLHERDQWIDPTSIALPSAYEELSLDDIVGVTSAKVTVANQLSPAHVSLHIEAELEGHFDLVIASADVKTIQRERTHLRLRRETHGGRYVSATDLQVFVATLVLTLDRHTIDVLNSEVASLSGGWPLGTRWRPD